MTTIAQERTKLAAVGRSLRRREQTGFKFGGYGNPNPVTEPSRLVFIHITITNPRNYANDDAHARAVEAIGISRFPNTGISYNRLIMQSGASYEGQPIGRQGAHTVNNKNITRCVSPGCPSKGGSIPSAATNLNDVVRAYAICQNVGDIVTASELDALARTIAADILAGFVTRTFGLHGHRCVAPKDCPAAQMWAKMSALAGLINHYVNIGFGTPQEDDMAGEGPAILSELRLLAKGEAGRYARYEAIHKATMNAIVAQSNAMIAAMKTEDIQDDAKIAAMEKTITELKAAVDALDKPIPLPARTQPHLGDDASADLTP